MNTLRHKPSLRERVAARKAGRELPTSRAERGRQSQWRLVAYALQAAGLALLIAFAWSQVEGGFKAANSLLLVGPVLLFVAGRGLHFWLNNRR